jgi:hypothetical protein
VSSDVTEKKGVLAVFKYLDDTCEALKKIKGRPECRQYEVYAPASYHELIEVAEEKMGTSQVRWFTLVGCLSGVTSGFGMCLLADYDWPIIVGGKLPGIYSLPAYVIFGFELMILFGAIATILGMLVMGRLPNPKSHVFDSRLSDDHFAIFIPNMDRDSEVAQVLKTCGACEVKSV